MTSLADRVHKVIVEGAKVLKLDSEPIEGLGEQSIIEHYKIFIENADIYLEEFTEDERPHVARTNRETFDNILEFQTTHYILRQNLPIEVINSLSKQDQRKIALDLLYAEPKRYIFFSVREKALQRFHEVGILPDLSDYCRRKELEVET